MTPESTATKLIDKFTDAMMENRAVVTKQAAKACALICVEEILKSISPKGFPNERYWQKVKEYLNQP